MSESSEMMNIPMEFINVTGNNPRKVFDQEALEELKVSILAHGILEPLIVRTVTGGYELIAGERRYRAAQQLEFHTVPCVVRELDDKEAKEVRLLENLQRQDLSPIEEASAIKEILADGLTQQELAKKLGKSQTWISQRIKLLDMPGDVVDLIISGAITPKHALALSPIAQYPKLMESAVDRLAQLINNDEAVTVEGVSEIITDVINDEQWNPVHDKEMKEGSVISVDPFDFWGLQHLVPHIDLSACEKCPKAVKMKERYGDDEVKYCLDLSCVSVKIEEAKVKFSEFQTQQAKELGVKGEVDSKQLRIDGVSKFRYMRSNEFDQSACTSCEKRKLDTQFKDSYLCLDPECYEKHQKEKKSADMRESKDAWSKTLIALDKATLPKQGGTLVAPTTAQKRVLLKVLGKDWEWKDAVNKAAKAFGCNQGNLHELLQDDDLDCVLARIMIMREVTDKVRYGGKPAPAMVEEAVSHAVNPPQPSEKQKAEDAEEEAQEYAEDVPDCYGDSESCCEECAVDCEYYEDCKAEIEGADD